MGAAFLSNDKEEIARFWQQMEDEWRTIGRIDLIRHIESKFSAASLSEIAANAHS